MYQEYMDYLDRNYNKDFDYDRYEYEFMRDQFIKQCLTKAFWLMRWPNHCKVCGGWGGATFQQGHPYGMGTAYETLFDPCDDGAPEKCHRCGELGLNEFSEGPCKHCGWDFDDGVPEVGWL